MHLHLCTAACTTPFGWLLQTRIDGQLQKKFWPPKHHFLVARQKELQDTKYESWNVHVYHKLPSRTGNFEIETENSVTIMVRLKWLRSLVREWLTNHSGASLCASCVHMRQPREKHALWSPAGSSASWLAGVSSTYPAWMSHPIHSWLREPVAGAALSTLELF